MLLGWSGSEKSQLDFYRHHPGRKRRDTCYSFPCELHWHCIGRDVSFLPHGNEVPGLLLGLSDAPNPVMGGSLAEKCRGWGHCFILFYSCCLSEVRWLLLKGFCPANLPLCWSFYRKKRLFWGHFFCLRFPAHWLLQHQIQYYEVKRKPKGFTTTSFLNPEIPPR